jgi:hypothetical protein
MKIDTPKLGKKMRLIGLSRSLFTPNIFDGFYLGKKPVITPITERLNFPEGHIFLSFGDNEEQKIHCHRASTLNLEYWCDGDDEPAYPVGIRVGEVKGAQLTPYELDFFKSKINEVNLIK